jgi:hypothetical protein
LVNDTAVELATTQFEAFSVGFLHERLYRTPACDESSEGEVDYKTTDRNETFKGTEVSRKCVASLIVKIINAPGCASRNHLGVNKPHTDGDRPGFA